MSEEKRGFFSRLKEGLSKTRNNIVYGIDGVFNGFSNIDEDFYEELSKRNFEDVLAVERKFLDTDHIEFLEFLLKHWHSDAVLVQSVRYLKTPHLAPDNLIKNAYVFFIIEKIFTPCDKVSVRSVEESINLMLRLKKQNIHFKIDVFIDKILKEYPHLPEFAL